MGAGILAKYRRRENLRTSQRLLRITRKLTDYANEYHISIKMEKLTDIRRLYRKRNGQNTSFRARMNTWVFGGVQRQIDYKARWDGVPVFFVNPRGSSSNCPTCGSRVARHLYRTLFCSRCDQTWDRDDLASKNIMACAVPQVRPLRGSSEKERDGDGSSPSSR